jgi:D-alanyl-D-alanine carboxypeptidase/D-alanyl-D-alanine-endopeptidase (penicillin-binding protein 4)
MKHLRKSLLLILILACFSLSAGCRARIAVPAVAGTPARIGADLEGIFSDPIFAGAQWGVEVLSLDRGDVLYAHNPTRLYMPASNNKILTVASALVRLGPDFHYETRISAGGPIADGTLRGNLIITGSGDPSLAPRFHNSDPFRVFKDWAAKLKEKGIRKIDGAIVGDARAFPPPFFGTGWEWDDLTYGYAAPVTALQFNENLITVEVSPGETEGSAATVRCTPMPDYLSIDAQVTTLPAGARGNIDVQRGARGEAVIVRGTIAAKAKPDSTTIAVENPALYYLAALKRTLLEEGLDVSSTAIRESGDSDPPAPPAGSALWTHSSPPLSEIVKPLLKVSQNLYAETLARTLGLALRNRGSFEAGREVVSEVLQGMAIPNGTFAYADGSGLSRHNLVSADMLVRIFRFMYRHRSFQIFYDALPIAGVDGTIRARLKGTKAENNVHAKTGTIAQVRCLSGYIKTADGEMLAFAMIANNFLAPNTTVEYVQDSALEYLANIRRGK